MILPAYVARVKGFVYQSVPPPDGDDILSDVTLALLVAAKKNGDRWTPPFQFVVGIAKHKIADHLRRKYRDRKITRELEKMFVETVPEPTPPHPALSPAELRVFKLIGRGMTNGEICAALNIGADTVKTHVHRIREKTGIGFRAKLALLAHDTNEETDHVCKSREDQEGILD